MDNLILAEKLTRLAKFLLRTGFLKSPSKIESIMKKNGMKVEHGEILFYLLLPSGSYDMDTVVRKYRSVFKAKFGEIEVDKSVNQENDYYNDINTKMFEFKTLVDKNDIVSAKKLFQKAIEPLIRPRVTVKEKKIVNDNIVEIAKLLKTDLQMDKLQSAIENVFKAGSLLIDRFDSQMKASRQKLKVIESLLDMEKKNPHLLEKISEVEGQVSMQEGLSETVELRGGLISDITKQVAEAIKNRQQLSFMYRKDTGIERRKVTPKKLEKLTHGMAVLAWNPERNGFGRYHFNKIV